MTLKRWLLLFLVLPAAAGLTWLLVGGTGTGPPPTGPVPPPDTIPALVPVDCRADSGGKAAVCYDAYLPRLWRLPGDGFVVIHVAVVPGGNDAPGDPVLYLHGGPAVPALAGFLPTVGHGFQQMYGDRDVIVFDQRGAGQSGPRLGCPRDQSYHDSLTDDLDESSIEWLARQTQPCLAELDPEDLAAFTTAELASDAADIVRMLGYRSVNLFGSSFGSRIALTYAAQADPGAVRSVVLEGPYPPNVDGVARRGEAAVAGLRALFAACRKSFSCNTAYPDLETRLIGTVSRLDAAPVTLPGGEVVNGRRFTEVLYRSAYSGSGLRRIPRLIADTGDGDLDVLGQLLDATAPTTDTIDPVAYFATVCATTTPDSAAELAATIAALPDGVAAFFSGLGETTLELCEEHGLPGDGATPGPTTVPTLYLVGTYDPVTPPAWSHEAARGSWPGSVAELSYGTHGNLLGVGTCAAQAVAELAATLDPPRPLCLSTTALIDFDL